MKHDASRIIQCILKYGSAEHRELIANELKGNFVVLAQNHYAKFIVSKVLAYCSNSQRASVMSEFHGKVRKLIRHKEASVIIDEAYSQYANAAQRLSLMEEFYGPEYALFKKVLHALGCPLGRMHAIHFPHPVRHARSLI